MNAYAKTHEFLVLEHDSLGRELGRVTAETLYDAANQAAVKFFGKSRVERVSGVIGYQGTFQAVELGEKDGPMFYVEPVKESRR